MPYFAAPDGTSLAYRELGDGHPLVCVPGGPGQASSYLGNLGGLDAHRKLIILDNRGTGASSKPADENTYRVDRLVDDIDALRMHLGLDRIDLFGHSASGGTCLLYALDYPRRVRRLVLANPSLRLVGLASDERRGSVLLRRRRAPWFREAFSAYRATFDPQTRDEAVRLWHQAAPLSYGDWNSTAKAHAAAAPEEFADDATAGFYRDLALDPEHVRARLDQLAIPMLVIGAEMDLWPTTAALRRFVTLLPDVHLDVIEGAGHFPWVDAPLTFSQRVERFLAA